MYIDSVHLNDCQKLELASFMYDKDVEYVKQFLQNFKVTFEFESVRTTPELAYIKSFNEALANIEATQKLMSLLEKDDLYNLTVAQRRAKYYREF